MSSVPPELTEVPVHGYRGAVSVAPRTRPQGLTVAISRQAGSRGTTIARKVATILDWQVFGSDTLDYLTHDDTARAQLLADIPADSLAWVEVQFARLQHNRLKAVDEEVERMVRLVLTVAARGNAVIVGRAAGFLLPPETTIHTRIVASLEARVAYLAQSLRLTRSEAAAEVHARDQRRAVFVNAVLALDVTDPVLYDVVVNSERLGVEGAAQFIGWAVRTKQMFLELAEPSEYRVRDPLDDLTG